MQRVAFPKRPSVALAKQRQQQHQQQHQKSSAAESLVRKLIYAVPVERLAVSPDASLIEFTFDPSWIKTSLLHAAIDNPYCVYPILYNWRRLSEEFAPCSSVRRASDGEEYDVLEHVMDEMIPYTRQELFGRLDCILAQGYPHHIIWMMVAFMEIDACFYKFVSDSYPKQYIEQFHVTFTWMYKRMLSLAKAPHFQASAGYFLALYWDELRTVVCHGNMRKIYQECSPDAEKVSCPRSLIKKIRDRRDRMLAERLAYDEINKEKATSAAAAPSTEPSSAAAAEAVHSETVESSSSHEESEDPAVFVMREYNEHLERQKEEEKTLLDMDEELREELVRELLGIETPAADPASTAPSSSSMDDSESGYSGDDSEGDPSDSDGTEERRQRQKTEK